MLLLPIHEEHRQRFVRDLSDFVQLARSPGAILQGSGDPGCLTDFPGIPNSPQSSKDRRAGLSPILSAYLL